MLASLLGYYSKVAKGGAMESPVHERSARRRDRPGAVLLKFPRGASGKNMCFEIAQHRHTIFCKQADPLSAQGRLVVASTKAKGKLQAEREDPVSIQPQDKFKQGPIALLLHFLIPESHH